MPKMNTRPAAALIVAAMLFAGCTGDSPKPRASSPPTTPTSSTSPTPTPTPITYSVPNRAVVYAFAADLWLYDLATESVRRLTSDGRSQYETQPRFRGRTTVTFIENGKTNGVFDLDLRTGFVTPVVSGVGVLAL